MASTIQQLTELRERTSLPLKDCDRALKTAGNVEDAIVLLKTWGTLKGKEKSSRIATEGVVRTFSNNSGTIVGIFELNTETDFCSRSKEFNELADMLCDKMNEFDETKFESARHDLIAKSGENIVLRRKEVYTTKDAANSSAFTVDTYRTVYEHPGNRLGVIVEFVCENPTAMFVEFADEIAMQIAAMAPVVVGGDNLSTDMLAAQQAIFEGQLTEEKKPVAAWPKIIEGKFAKWRKDVCLLEQESIKEAKKSIGQVLAETEKKLGCKITISRFVRYALGEGQVVVKENLADEVGKMIG
jgi:elongation factor Ts